MSCGVGCRCGSDPEWLWLWRRLVATTLLGPLAWEPPCAAGAALEKAKRQNNNNNNNNNNNGRYQLLHKYLVSVLIDSFFYNNASFLKL